MYILKVLVWSRYHFQVLAVRRQSHKSTDPHVVFQFDNAIFYPVKKSTYPVPAPVSTTWMHMLRAGRKVHLSTASSEQSEPHIFTVKVLAKGQHIEVRTYLLNLKYLYLCLYSRFLLPPEVPTYYTYTCTYLCNLYLRKTHLPT